MYLKDLNKFIQDYLDILNKIKEIVEIDKKYLKILDYQEKIEYNMNNNWQDEEIRRACEKLYSMLYDKNIRDQDAKILKRFGINENPEKILFESKQELPGKKYVYAFFIDYDSPEDQYGHSRDYGKGEKFYGSGKSNTSQEFFQELEETYRDCWWTEVRDVSSVYKEPESILYEYKGYLYRYYKK